MGAALSSTATQQADVQLQWLLHYTDSAVKYASYTSLETFTYEGTKYLALAYQASDAPHECSQQQHIRFALSKDGGETWTPSRVVMFGLAPMWAPVLFYDESSSRLLLFFSESRKALSPGGDIKYMASSDAGATWAAPVTVYTHEADGEVPKIAVNRPVVGPDGAWYLGFHREPARSFETFNAKTFSALRDAGGVLPATPAPATAPAQSMTTSAGVLVSRDAGATWRAGGSIEDPKTWLIEPAVECTTKGDLLALFRTATGRVQFSRSTDQGATWTKPAATALPNPNSKFATLTIDGQILMAYNASATARAPLALALSVDDGRSWEKLLAIEPATEGNFSYPCIVGWSEDTVKIAYTVWGQGLKLATVKLATVEV